MLLVTTLVVPAAARERPALDFTVPGIDDAMDLHGDPAGANLVVFVAGNQFMVMPALVRAFRALHPSVERIFYETLPPGIEERQIRQGSIEIGNLAISVRPDVVLAGLQGLKRERRAGVVGRFVPYATNALAIEVARGNPKHVAGIADLGRPDVRVAMPNPSWEGIAAQIERAYRKAGGAALDNTIMHAKVADGTTVLTRIHHRETPLHILAGTADAGPVWISEARYQQRIGNPIDTVPIPANQNVTAVFAGAVVRSTRHPQAAREFTTFLASPRAAAILRSYGFAPPPPKH
jgi:ABC-type molybdate transport system substrate-binding protein